MMAFPTEWNVIKAMFQTTNQLLMVVRNTNFQKDSTNKMNIHFHASINYLIITLR